MNQYIIVRYKLTSLKACGLPWVQETFLARFPLKGHRDGEKHRSVPEVFSRGLASRGFGQHRRFPPHARKTSGTQGTRGQEAEYYRLEVNNNAKSMQVQYPAMRAPSSCIVTEQAWSIIKKAHHMAKQKCFSCETMQCRKPRSLDSAIS